jgi:arylformamidase
MPAIDLEAEYNNRARVPEHPAIIAQWQDDAELWRMAAGDARGGWRYGPGPRQTMDLFGRENRYLPVLFIHGGYWQALDPSFFSHMARGLNKLGVDVAVMGYDLCPDVTVAAIVDQAKAACRLLGESFGKPVVVSGHSAGGHLAACLAADPDLPVAAGLGISGLYELEPLVQTSVNVKLGLDAAEARRLSPRFMAPVAGRPFDAWVGGAESAEYIRQSRDFAEVWSRQGAETAYGEVAGANHFTVIQGLAEPASAITRRLTAMAGA